METCIMGKWNKPPAQNVPGLVPTPLSPGDEGYGTTYPPRSSAGGSNTLSDDQGWSELTPLLPEDHPYAPYLPYPEPPNPPTPDNPCYPTALYAINQDSILFALDPATGQILYTVPVGTPNATNYLTSDPLSGAIYISNQPQNGAPGQLIKIDNGMVQTLDTLDEVGHAGIDPARDLIYLVQTNPDELNVIDDNTGAVLATYPITDGDPYRPVVDTDTGDVYVFGYYSDATAQQFVRIWKLDYATQTLQTIITEDNPDQIIHATYDRAHNKIYYASYLYFRIYDFNTHTVTPPLYTYDYIMNILYDPVKQLVYIMGSDKLMVYNPATEQITNVVDFTATEDDNGVYGIDLDADNHILYTTQENGQTHLVVAYDTDTWQELFRTDLGNYSTFEFDIRLGHRCDY
jgi:outer membrane protein assembly factor BamB